MAHTLYVCWYCDVNPHFDKKRYHLEMFNEISIMILLYILVIVSKFNFNYNSYSMYGSTYVIFIGFIIFVNILFLVLKSVKNIKTKLRMKKAKVDAETKKKKIQEQILVKAETIKEASEKSSRESEE